MPTEAEILNNAFEKAQKAHKEEMAKARAAVAAAEARVAELKAEAAAAESARRRERGEIGRTPAAAGFRAVRSLKRKGGRRNRKTRRRV
jgi:hypothetical protein